jgi:hypothetical protein
LGKELLGALMRQDFLLVLCTVANGNVQEAFWRGHGEYLVFTRWPIYKARNKGATSMRSTID